jgi:hypothetical protein
MFSCTSSVGGLALFVQHRGCEFRRQRDQEKGTRKAPAGFLGPSAFAAAGTAVFLDDGLADQQPQGREQPRDVELADFFSESG